MWHDSWVLSPPPSPSVPRREPAESISCLRYRERETELRPREKWLDFAPPRLGARVRFRAAHGRERGMRPPLRGYSRLSERLLPPNFSRFIGGYYVPTSVHICTPSVLKLLLPFSSNLFELLVTTISE
jgi:hypothetical protein